jgi:hypothetical protein
LAIFGLRISDETLAALIDTALKRGTPLTGAELCAAAGIEEAPPGAII